MAKLEFLQNWKMFQCPSLVSNYFSLSHYLIFPNKVSKVTEVKNSGLSTNKIIMITLNNEFMCILYHTNHFVCVCNYIGIGYCKC